MAFIPVHDAALMTTIFRDNTGVEAINRYYAHKIEPISIDDLTEIGTTFIDYFTEELQSTMEDNWSLVGVNVKQAYDPDGLFVDISTGLPLVGTAGSDHLPNQVSATITWLTGFLGRSNRGRTYIVGLPSSFVSPDQKSLILAAVDELNGKYGGLMDAMRTAGFPLHVVSLFSGGLPRAEGVTNEILAARCNFPLATQRRRLR